MKKIVILILATLSIIPMFLSGFSAKALTQTSAPYVTYTIGPKGRLVQTPTAYEPAGVISTQITLRQPEDMYLRDDVIYIADTGNKRIVKMELDGTATVLISGLNQPTGVHVDELGFIYVADKGDLVVRKFDALGQEVQRFTRPTEPIFGNTSPYVPIKVTSGPRGILYIVGEGSTNGVIQLNHAGEFLGFFATNQTAMSWYQKLASWFRVSLAKNIPISPSNVAIDEKGSLFTTSNVASGQVKKWNIASTNILTLGEKYAPVAVTINEFNNIYTISAEGTITEYDSYGNMIFHFGGLDSGNRVLGRFVNPIDLVTDSHNDLYILDKGTGEIQMLQRSEFTAKVHKGLEDFKDGIYDVDQWEEVLRMNSVFALANSAIARAKYRQMNYDEARSFYHIAHDKVGYSEAFWQVRYQWMKSYLGIVFGVGILALAMVKTLQFVDRKYLIYEPIRKAKRKVNSYRIARELELSLSIFRHPLDTFYEIKRNRKASYLSASILYALFIVVIIISAYNTSFIFNNINLETYSVFREPFLMLGIALLFVFSNYLISTLSSGEGWFRDVFIGTAYALTPYIVLTIPIVILSHGLTLNESFIYQMFLWVRNVWTVLLIIIMVKEIHNYKLRELIKNLLLTIFTMIMIVVICFLVYLLAVQMYDYMEGILREVILRGR